MAFKIQDLLNAGDSSEIQSSLEDLGEVLEEATKKAYQIPTETAISEAERPVSVLTTFRRYNH